MKDSRESRDANPQGSPRVQRGSTRATLVLTLALAVVLTACSKTGSDFSSMQSAVVQESGCDWARQIRFGVPGVLFSVARAGLSFVEIEPEARAALQTLRGLRVALYERASGTPDRTAMMVAADRAMQARGWSRVVGVLDRQEMVAVFAPDTLQQTRDLEVCVVVFDGNQLVFASGRANPAPLTELALRHFAAERDRLMAQR